MLDSLLVKPVFYFPSSGSSGRQPVTQVPMNTRGKILDGHYRTYSAFRHPIGADLARKHNYLGRAALKLTTKNTVLDLPVPSAELAALSGKYDSDEGPVEIFARHEKLHFRIPGKQIEGAMLRQVENVYAINENTEAHFLVRGSRASWSMVYIGDY